MEPRQPQDPRLKNQHGYDQPESRPPREGGDDALQASPDDSRLDEKVIVNEQRSDKVTNTPSGEAMDGENNEGLEER